MTTTKAINIKLKSPNPPYECSLSTEHLVSNAIHLIGFEFDGTACFRKGTVDGPNALRAVSEGIESYSPYLDADLENVTFYDLGNLDLEAIDYSLNREEKDLIALAQYNWQKGTDDFCSIFADVDLKNENIKVMTFGGEHSISYAPLKTYLEQFDDLCVIHLDAHADLRDGYLGFHYSHASIIRRTLDHFKPTHQLIQYGIRSGTAEEYKYMKEHKTLCTSREQFLQAISSIPANRPIYLTFDLDYFDPSFFPGTGTPEPGGEDFHSFVSLCKILKDKNFVGCDVVELSPSIDSTGNSDVFAAKIVRELILCLDSGNDLS